MQKIKVVCCCLLVFLACGAQARENTDVPEVAFPESEEWMRKPSELGVMAAGGVGYDGAIKILLPMVWLSEKGEWVGEPKGDMTVLSVRVKKESMV